MIKLPRVAAVHDMAGYSKCALTVVLPVLSACGVEVCPVPTANLSTNTSFKDFKLTDFTPYIREYLNHWQALGVGIDAVYSGFLSSKEQIDIVIGMKEMFKPKYMIIDPVMGDNGKKYATFDDEMCKNMQRLASCADVLTPNLTESCILTQTDYQGFEKTEGSIKNICQKLQSLGAKNIVLTGVDMGEELATAVLEEGGRFHIIYQKRLPKSMHGTGDTFTSVLCGKLLTGSNVLESARLSCGFVADAMEYSYGVENFLERGVCFEPLLHRLKK